MKLQGKAYVVETELGKRVCIESSGGTQNPLIIRSFGRTDLDSAENLCLSLNAWRESYALKAIEETVNEMEHLHD